MSDEHARSDDCDCDFICDFCSTDYSLHPEQQVIVGLGHDEPRDLGMFCSRFCAMHALTASISRDLADGPAPRVWRAGQLVIEVDVVDDAGAEKAPPS